MPDKVRFNIVDLWTHTKDLVEHNPNSIDLTYKSGYASLTKNACKRLAGSGMSTYEGSSIWTRATTWKFPLIQVFALSPRPPLNLRTEIFVLLHLLGNPIDSVQNLLLKISRCQKRVNDWKAHLDALNVPITLPEDVADRNTDYRERYRKVEQIYECRWKSMALVTDAYDEWQQADNQVDVMWWLLNESTEKEALLEVIQETSNALAADRATKYLPSLVALFSFIAIIGIAMARTASAIDTPAFNTSIFVSIEIHSVTFSSLYFWIIPTLLFGSFIGVSQTEARIPRILGRLHDDLDRHFAEKESHPNLQGIKGEIKKLRGYVSPDTDHRMFYGGIYSWQPSRTLADTEGHHDQNGSMVPESAPLPGNARPETPEVEASDNQQTETLLRTAPKRKPNHLSTTLTHLRNQFLPIIIVLIPTLTGAIVSSRVPPDGWNCRVTGEVLIFLAWLLNALSDPLIHLFLPFKPTTKSTLFWLNIAKDFFFAFGTMTWVLMTVIGGLNRCDCWIDHDGESLVLPQREDVDRVLRHRLKYDYPAWIFAGVAVELVVIPGWVRYWNGGALKVFVQRDDGRSNFEWWWDGVGAVRRVGRGLRQWVERKLGRKGRVDSGLSLR